MTTAASTDGTSPARERIVAAAADLMAQFGVADTSLRDIQAAAGVSPSQVYHYFGDKNGLVKAVLTYRKDTVLTMQTTMLTSVSSIDDLRRWAAEVSRQQARLGFRGGCPIGSLSYELARTDDEVAREVAVAFRRWKQALVAGLSSLVAAGVLPAGTDVAALSTTLLATVQGGLLLGQVEEGGQALETALNTVIELIETASSVAG